MSQPEIVTLAETKLWLRLTDDENAEDATVEMLIEAATATALATADAYDPADPAPPALRLAVLAHVVRAFDNRETVGAPDENGRLLMPLRTLGV